MPRRNLSSTGGHVMHVMNRGVRRLALFEQANDYRAFLRALSEGRARTRIRILAYCVMPNHFHLVLWPSRDGQLPEFMEWFQGTHARRWHWRRGSVGTGAVYQSRYRAFPVQTDAHFLTVCRYVERNPLRAGLVERAEAWQWSSLADRMAGRRARLLHVWPVARPDQWIDLVNQTESRRKLSAIRQSVARGTAYGEESWAAKLDLELEAPGRRRPGRPATKVSE